MLKKIGKLFELLKFKSRYPGVCTIGGPVFLKYFINWKPALKGFYSQEGQDALIFTEFFDKITDKAFPKRFLDVGCNHPIHYNNSYFFENYCNFDVVAIDALDFYKESWNISRPRAVFENCAVGAKDGEVEFSMAIGDGVESMYSAVVGMTNKNKGIRTTTNTVSVRTIGDLLRRHKWEDVGIMSMDIEGFEKEALAGINFNNVKFRLIVIENNSENFFGDCGIRDMLVKAGYIFFARIWGLDDLFVHKEMLETSRRAFSGNSVPQHPLSM